MLLHRQVWTESTRILFVEATAGSKSHAFGSIPAALSTKTYERDLSQTVVAVCAFSEISQPFLFRTSRLDRNTGAICAHLQCEHPSHMGSTPNANGTAPSAKCGPALMISMVLVVVIAVAALIFFQNSKKVVAQPAARPITTTTPKK